MWKSNFGRPTPSTRRRPRNCICSMAWSFHAIDTRMPPFLRLLDGVQVDNLTHCLISTQASTGGCGRKGCWLALLVLRILMITGGRTRWLRTARRPSTTRLSRSNWPATASPQIQVSRRICLVCRTRRRSTPGALILDRGRRRKSGLSWPRMWEEIETASSRISGRRSPPFATRRTRARAARRTTDIIGSVVSAACPGCAGR